MIFQLNSTYSTHQAQHNKQFSPFFFRIRHPYHSAQLTQLIQLSLQLMLLNLPKFVGLNKLKDKLDEFNELGKLNCKLDELDKLRMSSIS